MNKILKGKIRSEAWREFATSKYVVNLTKINFSNETLQQEKFTKEEQIIELLGNNDKIYIEYLDKHGKCSALFEKNNFNSLEKIDIGNNKIHAN